MRGGAGAGWGSGWFVVGVCLGWDFWTDVFKVSVRLVSLDIMLYTKLCMMLF